MSAERPTSLDGIIGQNKLKEALRLHIKAAKLGRKQFPHILLSSPSGYGKTSFGYAIAGEVGAKTKYINCSAISSVNKLIPILTQLEQGDLLILDEVHALPKRAEESLYNVLEDNKLIIGGDKESITIDIPNFSTVALTTNAGDIATPLKNRFNFALTILPYEDYELTNLVRHYQTKYGLSLPEKGIERVYQAGRGTPRIIIAILSWLADAKLAYSLSELTIDDINKVLRLHGIDGANLNDLDREYLKVLKKANGPLSLSSLTLTLGVSSSTIEETEIFLVKQGIVKRTPKGRVLA